MSGQLSSPVGEVVDELVRAVGLTPDSGAPRVDEPRPLPAHALDHATGWLVALAAVAALLCQHEDGGSLSVELSLERTAQWWDGLGRIDGLDAHDPPFEDVADLLDTVATPLGQVTHVRPPGRIAGTELRWETPPTVPASATAVRPRRRHTGLGSTALAIICGSGEGERSAQGHAHQEHKNLAALEAAPSVHG